jgi:hypothetical protein
MKKAKNTWKFYWWNKVKWGLYRHTWQIKWNSEHKEFEMVCPYFGLFYDDPTLPF